MQLPVFQSTFRLLLRAALFAMLMPIVLPAQTVSTIHNFEGPDGGFPTLGPLIQGRDGYVYGMTGSGGILGCGSIFKQGADSNSYAAYRFSDSDACSPFGGLTLGSDGNYYGVTPFGGVFHAGDLFKITPSGLLTELHSFGGSDDGIGPDAAPIEASDGSLYGTTGGSDTVLPTVYRYSASSGFSSIYTFTDFVFPLTPLLESSEGYFYLVTPFDSGCGSIVKLTRAGVVKSIHKFSCGSGPEAAEGTLIEAADGFIYGTSRAGGPFSGGTVFRLDAETGALTVLYNFGSIQNDGSDPVSGLVQGSDRQFYGTTSLGGANNSGTLFKISSDGTYTQLYSFPVVSGSYSELPEGLVQHTDGAFYGATFLGGIGLGSIFKLDVGLAPFITFVRSNGKVGRPLQVLGQGLTGTTAVSFNGVSATSFRVMSDTYMVAVVPSGASTGPVVVTVPGGALTSNKNFIVKK
jgi:uncharacterized repeat protein (TIGR03803 family)